MKRVAAILGLLSAGIAGVFFATAASPHSKAVSAQPTLASISGYLKGAESLGWAGTGASGYVLFRDGRQVSTAGPNATSAKFSVAAGNHVLSVQPLPPAPPPTSSTVATTTVPATTTAPVTTTQPVATTQPATTTTSVAGQVSLSPSGNDAGCSRNGSPCRSFNQADQIAQSGDTIVVSPGVYTGPTNYGYANSILTSTPVTFVCAAGAAADSVSTSDPGFLVGPGGGNVTFQGSCFHFHIIAIGLRGYDTGGAASNRVHDVTLNGVHMDSFDITGVKNVLVENSQVGPINDCYGSGHGSADCDPNSPVEAYWASVGGTTDLQGEPFVHNNGPDPAQNVTFDHDRFTGMQTKDPNFFHQGGLLIWDTSGLKITNSTFDHNAIYDIEENAGSGDTGMVFSGDTFGQPVYTLADSTPGQPLPDGWRDVTLGGYGIQLSNSQITANSFVNGLSFSTSGSGWSYSGVTVTNNTGGTANVCPTGVGISYSGNQGCP